MKPLEQIEAELIAACEYAMLMGWKITDGNFVLYHDKCCCPIGALAKCDPMLAYCDHFAKVTGTTCEHAEAFYEGFDGCKLDNDHSDFYALGQRLRKRYLKYQP